MKEIIVRVACCISIILIVMASGCVAPPKENATSTKNGNPFNPNQPGELRLPRLRVTLLR